MTSEAYVVLLTGGSRGTGRATAVALAKHPHVRVAFTYHSHSEDAAETLGMMAGAGHASFQVDLGSVTQCEDLVAKVVAKYGRIDALINNAGAREDTDLRHMDFAQFATNRRRLTAVNLTAASNLTLLVTQQMLQQSRCTAVDPTGAEGCRGRIVNLSGRSAFRADPTSAAYGASKAGLSMLAQTLARSLGPDGIAFFSIAPTLTAAELARRQAETPEKYNEIVGSHPIGRLPTPEELARTVAWFAVDAPLAATGSVVDLNGASHVHH